MIKIEDGFEDEQSDEDPPTLEWEFPYMENPRSTAPTGVFNVTIIDSYQRVLYYWDSSTSPTVIMKTAADPTSITYTRTSEANGDYNPYTFVIKNNNIYQEGDVVWITLPSSMAFSSSSTCSNFVGFTAQDCDVSTALD
jgi:hypothetical protein